MVLKKKQECGFYGYQFPAIPRAPRTVRKSCLIKDSVDDDELCAFELLATVAGKLLQESKSSASSNAAGKEELGIFKDAIKEEKVGNKAVRSDCLDQGSFIESVLISESTALERNIMSTLKELPHCESNNGCTSAVSSSDLLKKVGCDVKLETYTSHNAVGSITSKAKGKLYDGHLGIEDETAIEVIEKQTGKLNVANSCSSKEPMEFYVNNTNTLINSASRVKVPSYRTYVPYASFPKHRNNVKIVSRDDDENYFRRLSANTNIRAFGPQSHIGYRRTRKMQTSKYWKAIPKLKDDEVSNTGRGVRSFYHKRKIIYARERCQHEVNSKRRLLGDQRATVAYDNQASSESITNCREKAMKGDKCGTPAISHRATGVPSSSVGHKVSLKSKDPHVKLSIKSFKVPELYIEVPETATVGSLKRTVMEAATAILGGGLRVGVVLRGKKVRDDNRTLLQTGISRNENLESLGFTLESSLLQVASPPSPKDPTLPCDSPQQSSRPQVPVLDSGFSNSSFDLAPVTKFDDYVESNHEVVPSVTDESTEGSLPDSKALVGIFPMNAEPLTVVPVNSKTKRSELSNRRTRRPFSVSEVEALVESVEKLGTGRWRDVKMRAFDDANHRTYVDLKDKWKTLVHTASIAPQQRRGEPVPQVLLDRVLGAHAYWSQHQLKQHGKHPNDPLKFGKIGA